MVLWVGALANDFAAPQDAANPRVGEGHAAHGDDVGHDQEQDVVPGKRCKPKVINTYDLFLMTISFLMFPPHEHKIWKIKLFVGGYLLCKILHIF